MHVIRDFLTKVEIDYLLSLWRIEDGVGWHLKSMRKDYRFIPCPGVMTCLREKALLYLPHPRFDELLFTDSFFIYYDLGGMTKPHTDTRSGLRLNALVLKPNQGDFRIEGKRVPLEVGDAVVFHPNKERHEVTSVSPERLVWSVGRTKEPPQLTPPAMLKK